MTDRPSDWEPPSAMPEAQAGPPPAPPAPPPGVAPAPTWGQYAPSGPAGRPPGTESPLPQASSGTGPWGQAPAYGQYGQYGPYVSGLPVGFGPGPLGGPAPAPRPGIIPLRPLGLGEMLDGAFRAIRTNPRVMFGLSAVVVAFTALIQAVVTWQVFAGLESALGSVSEGSDTAMVELDVALGDLLSQLGVALGAQTITAVVTTILSGLLIVSVSQSVIGRTASLANVWGSARGQIVRLLLLSLIVLIIVAGPVVGWAGALVATIAAEQFALTALIGIIGGLAVLVAVAVLATRTLLATPALMLERSGIWTALRRGWDLTRGTFWRVLGIYLLTSLLVSLVAGTISGSASIFLQLTAGNPANPFASPAYLIGTTLAQVVAATLTTPFTAAVVALLYIDVRMRTEGLDLELARAAEKVD